MRNKAIQLLVSDETPKFPGWGWGWGGGTTPHGFGSVCPSLRIACVAGVSVRIFCAFYAVKNRKRGRGRGGEKKEETLSSPVLRFFSSRPNIRVVKK